MTWSSTGPFWSWWSFAADGSRNTQTFIPRICWERASICTIPSGTRCFATPPLLDCTLSNTVFSSNVTNRTSAPPWKYSLPKDPKWGKESGIRIKIAFSIQSDWKSEWLWLKVREKYMCTASKSSLPKNPVWSEAWCVPRGHLDKNYNSHLTIWFKFRVIPPSNLRFQRTRYGEVRYLHAGHLDESLQEPFHNLKVRVIYTLQIFASKGPDMER